MKIISDKDGIVELKAEDQYELTATFQRMQEFYESPQFAGKVFDHEEYMDWYAQRYGNYTYHIDWNGFNVPGEVVIGFFQQFTSLNKKESAFEDLLQPYISGDKPFYIIGTHGEETTARDVMRHELAHAFFYVDMEYQAAMDRYVNELLPEDYTAKVFKWLADRGYHENVFVDECHAYLSTNSMLETDEDFKGGLDTPWDMILQMQRIFNTRYQMHYGE